MTKITCHGCGKVGHFVRNCQSKNKVVRTINMLRKGPVIRSDSGSPGDAEDWELVNPDKGRLYEDSTDDESCAGNDDYEEAARDKRRRHGLVDRSSTPHPATRITMDSLRKIRDEMIQDGRITKDVLDDKAIEEVYISCNREMHYAEIFGINYPEPSRALQNYL